MQFNKFNKNKTKLYHFFKDRKQMKLKKKLEDQLDIFELK